MEEISTKKKKTRGQLKSKKGELSLWLKKKIM